MELNSLYYRAQCHSEHSPGYSFGTGLVTPLAAYVINGIRRAWCIMDSFNLWITGSPVATKDTKRVYGLRSRDLFQLSPATQGRGKKGAFMVGFTEEDQTGACCK